MSRVRSNAGWLLPALAVAAVIALAAWQLLPANSRPRRRLIQPLLPPLAQPTGPDDFATVMAQDEGREAGHREEAQRAARGPLRPRRPRRPTRKMTRGKPIQAGPAREAARRA